MKRLIIRITPHAGQWRVQGPGLDRLEASKRPTVRLWATLLNAFADAGGRAQLVIHGSDGQLEEERTYPRSSDPRRTKG